MHATEPGYQPESSHINERELSLAAVITRIMKHRIYRPHRPLNLYSTEWWWNGCAWAWARQRQNADIKWRKGKQNKNDIIVGWTSCAHAIGYALDDVHVMRRKTYDTNAFFFSSIVGTNLFL